MAQYNLQRAPKNIEKRFYNAYREDLEKIGVTQQDIDQKGVPDLDKSRPPKGSWSDGYVTETGISYLEEALREYYNKPIIFEEEKPKPKRRRKKPKQRGAFRTFIESPGVSEELVGMFKAIASLPPKEKEEISEVLEDVIEKTPRKRGRFKATIKKAGVEEDISSLFRAVASTQQQAPKLEEPEKLINPKASTNLPKLPKELAGARCNYRDAALYFANDIDKAAYIISSKSGKKDSARHRDYVKWAERATGWHVSKIAVLGLEIKSNMKELYAKAQQEGDFFINVPDFYSKFKSEFDDIAEEEIETEEEPTPKYDFPGYSYSQFLENYPGGASKKQKRDRSKGGELTKRQEELLHGILEDLIKIRHRLAEIKKNQDDKIAYEKRRDRLQAERLSFIERERQIEALPQPTEVGTKESKSALERSDNKKDSWYKPIVQNSLLSGIASLFLGGGGGSSTTPPAPAPTGTPSTTPGSPTPTGTSSTTNNFNVSQYTKPLLRAVPIPGMSMIPFAEGGVVGPTSMLPFANGGTIQPIGSNSGGTSIRPLESITGQAKGGETTYSRGFSMEDLKSPLAEVMKLPLKVAGAALLSAISKLSSQFDVSDQKLQSDLSKMIGDISKAFGLQKPTFGGTPSSTGVNVSVSGEGGGGGSQSTLASSLNEVASALSPTGSAETQTTPPPTPSPETDNNDTNSSTPASPANPDTPNTTSLSNQQTQSSQTSSEQSNKQAAISGSSSDIKVSSSNTSINSSNNSYNSDSLNSNTSTYNTNSSNNTRISSVNVSNISDSITNKNLTNKNSTANNSLTNNLFTSSSPFASTSPSSLVNNSSYNQYIANQSVFEQNQNLKFNPSEKLTPSSIAIAMGFNLPKESNNLYNSNGVNVISLPAINKMGQQSIPTPEVTVAMGKEPSGGNGRNFYVSALVG